MLITRWNEASRALPVLALKSNYLDCWPTDCQSKSLQQILQLHLLFQYLCSASSRMSPNPQLSHIDITPTDVYNALFSIDPTKAVGCDNIHPFILKHCAATLCTPVTNLYPKPIASN